MRRFAVWGPRVQKMELRLEHQTLPMQKRTRGEWSLDVPDVGAGARYGFILDGEGPLPDPRSPFQPDGVHGLSQVIDHNAFQWHDQNFQAPPLASGIVYELHVGTFTPAGTFDAAIEKLDDLRNLGVTHVELMPVAEFPGARGWGYDGVDLYAPHHAYGGPTGLKRLVDACHARGLAAMLDVVYNHLGPDGNYLDRFAPYHSVRHQTDWGAGMNFDEAGSDEVRRFFIDNALMWLRDYHFDGLRLDAADAIADNSAVHILEALSAAVERLSINVGRHLILIAESNLDDPRIVRPRALGGYGIDAQWSDDFHHALHVTLTGETRGYYIDFQPWDDLAKALTQTFVLDGRYSILRDRHYGRPVGEVSAHRFLGFIQNHDQIGNRALGERIGQLSPALTKIAAALVLTAPFVPMLFMGEEWNASTPFQYFTEHNAELGRLVTEGRRREVSGYGTNPDDVPDPQDPATWARSKLKWNEIDEPTHAEMLAWTRQLIALRRSQPALLDGEQKNISVRFDKSAGWLLVTRGDITVACNFSARIVAIDIPQAGSARVLLTSDDGAHVTENKIQLSPHGVLIFTIQIGN